MAALFSCSIFPLCTPDCCSHVNNCDRLFISLLFFLKTRSAFRTLVSRSLATRRREEPPDFIKARWALQALMSWAVSTSSLRRTEEKVLHTSSSLFDLSPCLFRRSSSRGWGMSLGMLAANLRVLVVASARPWPMCLAVLDTSRCILLPTLSRPRLTFPASLMGLTPGLRGLCCR